MSEAYPHPSLDDLIYLNTSAKTLFPDDATVRTWACSMEMPPKGYIKAQARFLARGEEEALDWRANEMSSCVCVSLPQMGGKLRVTVAPQF